MKTVEQLKAMEKELLNGTNTFTKEQFHEECDIQEGVRICDCCGKLITEGYVIQSSDYYCSEKCMNDSGISREHYLDLHDDGDGDSYYTEWEEITLSPKQQALYTHLITVENETSLDAVESVLGCSEDDIVCYKIGNDNYSVYTDEEADIEATQQIQNTLDEELYCIPSHLRYYFDEDSYIEDRKKDRGQLLAYANSYEYEYNIDGDWYYIYKV